MRGRFCRTQEGIDLLHYGRGTSVQGFVKWPDVRSRNAETHYWTRHQLRTRLEHELAGALSLRAT